MNQRSLIQIIVAAVVIVILIFVFSNAIFITIQPGEKGVKFRKFSGGIDTEFTYGQGFHVIAPWNKMIIYNVQKQEKEESMDVLSSNGLAITLDVSIRFSLIGDKIGFLHNEIGDQYINKIIIPEVRSATRKIIGNYTPEELYSSKRNAIQNEIESSTKKVLRKNYINLDALLIRSVKLPDKIKQAIERKLEQEQQAQEYQFRIEKERKEKERKKIEAEGIQQFQRIVTEGISDKLLKWKGIEATQDLAKSPNSKIIIIGSGKDELPVILNADK